LNALRHEKTYEQKFETQAARRAESLHQYSGFVSTCKKERLSAANPLVR
jgi:heme-degrading monooxygenase HmoA